MIDNASPLLLGSGSPRRRDILASLGIPTVILAGHADESVHAGENATNYISRVVREKLCSVGQRLDRRPVGAILVADTIVLLDEQVLGKPMDQAEAARMIASLSGRSHEVWTRFAISRPREPEVAVHEETVRTRVVFRQLANDEINGYAASGEGLDKAGAYAIQGLGAFAVERIDGSYGNVVGLPACEVVQALRRAGLISRYPL